MPFCSKCGEPVTENDKFCPKCGTPTAPQPQAAPDMPVMPNVQPAPGAGQQNSGDFAAQVAALNNTADTTAEFDPADIASNKAMAILSYFGLLVLIPLLAVTLDTLDEKLTKTRRRILAALTIAWGVLFVAVCRAIGAGAGDNTLLQWVDFVADRTDRLPVLGQVAWLAVWRAVIAVGVAVLGVLLVRRRGRRVLAGAALCSACCATRASGASTAGRMRSPPGPHSRRRR